MKILILDDETDRAESWKKKIEGYGDFDVIVPGTGEVSSIIADLHTKRLESRKEHFNPSEALSGYDLVMVDYDLLGLETVAGGSAWSTGAEVAYAGRLMCDVGPIVVVNQFGTNSFDLTMSRTSSSYADLDVGSEQVAEPSLWSVSEFSGFRPWHWPNLISEKNRFTQMHEFVLNNLNTPITQALGFEVINVESPRFIGHEILGYLGIESAEVVTFRQLLTERRDIRVFNVLEKDLPLLKNMDDRSLSRVCAVVVSHWLEKIVMPNQEVVADLPHLAPQLPWVLADYSDEESWSKLCFLTENVFIPESLAEYQFQPSFMFSRPVFWAEEAKAGLEGQGEFDIHKLPSLKFCEDVSSFKQTAEAKSFPSDLLSFDKERWVHGDLRCGNTSVNYEPQSYLLM
ncbi:hypothetical protein GXB78_26595 [Pseudomonas moraviensis subsp. stanleyae]|uniref:hypothetical protein n=1 Tax=Pseudomonas moraviensis TaxID=321662 RepID=UPI002E2FBC36|nr:hypothetical protein [Pseudomonas moraviensis]MED7670775.1 hypothetical protein [Pseudomonas moraviensis subsp. stanleyae]